MATLGLCQLARLRLALARGCALSTVDMSAFASLAVLFSFCQAAPGIVCLGSKSNGPQIASSAVFASFWHHLHLSFSKSLCTFAGLRGTAAPRHPDVLSSFVTGQNVHGRVLCFSASCDAEGAMRREQ